jgi:hypothetical protein
MCNVQVLYRIFHEKMRAIQDIKVPFVQIPSTRTVQVLVLYLYGTLPPVQVLVLVQLRNALIPTVLLPVLVLSRLR